MRVSHKADPEWVPQNAAGRIIGCPAWNIPKLAAAGYIAVKELPGGIGRPRYLRADCEKLAKEIVTPAYRNTPEEAAV
jgi:hypothetical protein